MASLRKIIKWFTHPRGRTSVIFQGKNVQVENAVEDMIGIVCAYPLDEHIEPVAQVRLTVLIRCLGSVG